MSRSDPALLEMIDDALVDHIEKLKTKKFEEDSNPSSAPGANSTDVAADIPAVAVKPPFDFFPAVLKVGDTVRRGPAWVRGFTHQN